MNNEIKSRIPLLDEHGEITEPGYARSMLLGYDRGAIRANKLRIKEWDYYLIYNQRYAVALTVADNSYMGMMSASFIDFKTRTQRTTSPMTFMPLGKTDMPSTSAVGDTCLCNKRADFCFQNDGKKRVLRAKMKNFDGKKDFYAEFVLDKEPEESMVIATPFAKKKHFYYNQKIVGFEARGFVCIGDQQFDFGDDAFALLDWGRGVWTYSNTWYWSSACGVIDGAVFGFNLGYGFGDTSAASENMLFWGGKGHKLDRVTFDIPQNKKKLEFLERWKITDNEGRLDLTFEPLLDRYADANALVLRSTQHQVFGYFDGTAVLDNGQKLNIKKLLGFAEKVDNRW